MEPTAAGDSPSFFAATVEEWRAWLEEHGESARSVRLIVYSAKSGVPGARWADVIEHALCYGWVDSKAVRRDADSVYLTFTPRKPDSTWGKRNRARAEGLIRRGLMTPSGQRLIDLAKQRGTWDALAEAQNGVVPEDLQRLFAASPTAEQNFTRFPPSSQSLILTWIASAKRPETRRQRLEETVRLAEENRRAHH